MKNRPVNVIPSSCVMITTLVYALLAAIFLELDNVSGEKDINVNDIVDNDNKSSPPKLVDASYKSPCSSNAEMCIQMCA